MMMGALCAPGTHTRRNGGPSGGFTSSMVQQGSLSRTQPLSRYLLAENQQLQPGGSRGGCIFLHQLLWLAVAGVVLFGEPAACKASTRGLPRVISRERASDGQGANQATSLIQLAGAGKPAEITSLKGGTRDSVKAHQRVSAVVGSVMDPFSATQMLSTDKYREELRAQVHLHRSRTGVEGGNSLAQDIGGTEHAPSILNRRRRATRQRRSYRARLDIPGEALVQLAPNLDFNDTQAHEDETELLLPARVANSNVEPHLPLLPEFFSEEQGPGDEATEQGISFEGVLPERKARGASLVEASSTAHTGKQSAKEEKDDEGESQSQSEEAEQESKSENASNKHTSAAGESTKDSETAASAASHAAASGKEEEATQHEGSLGHAAEAADEEKDSALSTSASLKPASAAPHAAASGKEEEATQHEGSLGHAAEAADEEKDSALSTSASLKPETTGDSSKAAPGGEEGREQRAGESMEPQNGTAKLAGTGEVNRAKPVGETQQTEAGKRKPVETPHKKTEKEETEERHRHSKELAERATRLANIQRMEQEALLKLHMLGEGGPRENVASPSGTSSMSVQDKEQHKQLEEATKAAQNLTAHLRVQHELKQREMALKQKEIAHLNLLKHIQVQNSLKRLVQQSLYVNKKFLRETDNRVLRPQELPKAVMSDEERKRGAVLAKKQGVTLLDCPVECAQNTCDNKPSFPTHCFKYDMVAGGGGFRTCAPFADEATAACPERTQIDVDAVEQLWLLQSYTRCAMAAPVRGRRYELLASTSSNPLPQALFIMGNNLHSCLRLMAVHPKTECTPTDTQSVLAALQDSQTAVSMPPPRVLDHGVIFENIQIASPGEYKLCMLQFWVPPEGPKGNVVVLGVDEIGTVVVQDLKARKPPAGPAQAEKAAEAAELEMAELRRENLLLPVVPVANEQAKSSTAAGASSDTAMQTERHAAKTGTDEA